jgi:Phosphotransferase enzyme family
VRHDGAIDAALRCARALGLYPGRPVTLRATNNVVLWLAPLPIVAKAAEAPHRALAFEVEIGRGLAEARACAVGPAPGIAPRVHRAGNFGVTFWRYVPQGAVSEPPSRAIGAALGLLHNALGRLACPGARWARCSEELVTLAALLERDEFAPNLAGAERSLLRRAVDEGVRQLAPPRPGDVRLHGSPHRLNIVVEDGSPRFIDFETVCSGPAEWDLAHVEPGVEAGYPYPVDAELLAALRVAVSAKTAAWCWHSIDAGPDMAWHARHHLELVKDAHR